MPESPLAWRRSTKCESAACVEVALSDGSVLVRHSRHPAGPVLQFSADEWQAFCAGVKGGEFQHPSIR
jgi:hypothetical protein